MNIVQGLERITNKSYEEIKETFLKKRKLLKKKDKFLISSKNFFLTYPRCDISCNDMYNFLKEKINSDFKEFIIVRETHSKNDLIDKVWNDLEEIKIDCYIRRHIKYHLHCYISCTNKVKISNPDTLRYEDKKRNLYFHGNYQPVRNKKAVCDYLLKDLENLTIDNNLLISDNLKKRLTKGGLKDGWDLIIHLAEQGDFSNAIEIVKEKYPKEYLKNHKSLFTNFKNIYLSNRGLEYKYSMKDFIIPQHIQTTLIDNFQYDKTYYIKGAPGIGKTQFICTFVHEVLKRDALMINNIDALHNYLPGKHDALILDDVNFNNLQKREELIKLIDIEVTVDIRIIYGTVQILSKTLRIFISNQTLESYFPNIKLDKAIKRRILVIDLGDKKLFKDSVD